MPFGDALVEAEAHEPAVAERGREDRVLALGPHTTPGLKGFMLAATIRWRLVKSSSRETPDDRGDCRPALLAYVQGVCGVKIAAVPPIAAFAARVS